MSDAESTMRQRFSRSVVTACVGALSAASIDGTVGFIVSGGRFSSPSFAVLAVALTALLAFLVILAIRWVLAPPIFRRTDPDALSIASAVAVVAFVVAHDVGSTGPAIVRLLEWCLDAGLAVVAAIGWYALVMNDRRTGQLSPLRVAGRALAFVMPLGLLAAWVIFVLINDVTSVGAVVTLLVFAAVVGIAVRVVRFVPARGWSLAVLAVFAGLIAFGAAEGVALQRRSDGAIMPAHATGAGRVRRVILLTVDTLRRDSLSCYGSTVVRTPAIDELAADGCLFRRATSTSSWTVPAFASMMTALPTSGHGLRDAGTVLPDTVVTLAERFREAGYATCGVVANGLLAAHRGFAQGFDRYDLREVRLDPVNVGDALAAHVERHLVEEATDTKDVTDVAIEWTNEHRDEDFFLWVHYMDPHLPYDPPRKFVERINVHDEMGYSLNINSMVRPTIDLFGTPAERAWVRSLYDAEVRYVDSEIGRLLRALRQSGIYDEAMIVFSVDHGEEFWDHDGFEHGHTLFEELVGVPLIVKAPAARRARVIDEGVSLYDMAPTILDMCGLPGVDTPTGVSLADCVNGAIPGPPARPLFSGATLFRSNWESVTFDGWKYIRSITTGRELLFHLADDPAERSSLALRRKDLVARGRALLDEHERAMEAYRQGAGISNPILEMDAEELERLRSLGYL